MKESTITIRVDEKLKERAIKACNYMGTTLSSVMTHALRSEIYKYQQQSAQDSKDARNLAEGENYQLMLNAAMREAEILKQMGISEFLKLTRDQRFLFYKLYHFHIQNLVMTRPDDIFGIDGLRMRPDAGNS